MARSRKGGLGKRVGLALVALAALLLLGSVARVPVLRQVASVLLSPLQGAFRTIGSVGRLSSENSRLRAAAARLAVENFSLREASLENTRLRRMLEFAAASTFRLEPARVLAREAGPFGRGLKIGKGTSSGLTVNMPVVSHEGLVGKLIEVTPSAAYLQYIQDPDFRVSVLIQRSRTAGILAWEPRKGVQVLDIAHHADVEEGDLVVTSGLGELFPKGILVGRVTRVSDEEGGLFQSVSVRPFVEFAHLEEVFLITGTVERSAMGPASAASPFR